MVPSNVKIRAAKITEEKIDKPELKQKIAQETAFVGNLLKLADGAMMKKDGYAEGYLVMAKMHIGTKIKMIGQITAANYADIGRKSAAQGFFPKLQESVIGRLQKENKQLEDERKKGEEQIAKITAQLEKLRPAQEPAKGQ